MSEEKDRPAESLDSRIDLEQRLWDDKYAVVYDDPALMDITYTDYAAHFSSTPEFRPIHRLMPDVRGAKALECGAGTGVYGVEFALSGAEVTATDVSVEAGRALMRRAEYHKVSDRVRFFAMPMEKMDLPDASFDFVFGCAVLHHVMVEEALRETMRVLKPGGRYGFVEPLGENPAFNAGRLLKERLSGEKYGTDVPFRFRKLNALKREFPGLEYELFDIAASLKLFIKRPSSGPSGRLSIIRRQNEFAARLLPFDKALMKAFPPSRRLARLVTICGVKK